MEVSADTGSKRERMEVCLVVDVVCSLSLGVLPDGRSEVLH